MTTSVDISNSTLIDAENVTATISALGAFLMSLWNSRKLAIIQVSLNEKVKRK